MKKNKAVKNVVYSLSYQIFNVLFGFFVPNLIISTYGSEINGLTSTIMQFINILALLQAGIIGSSIFEMYKPISEGNTEIEASIFYSSENTYKKLSIVMFILSLLIIPYLLLTESLNLSFFQIAISVIALAFNTCLNFRYFSSFDIVFSAHEEKSTIIVSQFLGRIGYYIVLFVTIYFKFSFLWLYFANLVGTAISIMYIKISFNKKYNNIYKKVKPINYKIKNHSHLFFNQATQQIIEAMPIIIVSFYYGLKYVSIYSVYFIILNLIKTIFITILNAIAATFGNIFASSSKKKISDNFHITFMLIILLSVIVLSVCGGALNTFISVYTHNLKEIEYLNESLTVVSLFYLFSYILFSLSDMFLNAMGLYKSVSKSTIIIGIVSTIICIVCTKLNYSYALLGCIVFYLVCGVIRLIIISYKVSINSSSILKEVLFLIIVVIGFFVIFNNLRVYNYIQLILLCIGLTVLASIIVGIFAITVEKQIMMKIKEIKNE